MTRINTNVSSLIAQKTLSRTNAELQTSLTRLSTGLRINTGKDDPAGLIASENLRRDITSIEKAVSNSERANQLIATADSALGQVSSLLNDIRGLVVEAANSGALSDEQIAANQLQVDSSLEAIDRIAQVTTFQGRKILDGSLSFLTSAGTGFNTVANLQIDQANLGSSGQLNVDITIAAAATQASITNTGVGVTPGNSATGTLTFSDITGSGAAATGTLTFADITTPEEQATSDLSASALTDAANITGTFDVLSTSSFAGVAGNDLTVVFAEDSGTAAHTASLAGDVLTITVGTQGAGATIALADILADLSSEADFADNLASTVSAGDYTVGTDDGATLTFAGGVDEVSDSDAITITAAADGTAFNGTISIVTLGSVTAGSIDVSATGGNITITLDDSSTYDLADIAQAINDHADYNATLSTNDADGQFVAGTDTNPTGTMAGGAVGASDDDVITITANASGTAFNGTINVVTSSTAATGSIAVAFASGALTITLDDSSTYDLGDIVDQINTTLGDDFTASLTGTDGDGDFVAGTDTNPTGTLAGGTADGGAGLTADVVVEIAGRTGSEVFSFQAGTTITQIINAVNLVSDATGVQAANNGGQLQFSSAAYGSAAFVDVNVISEGTGGQFGANLSATRAAGTDINATVNGVAASGEGNMLSINTATLDLKLTVDAGSSTAVNFTVVGGGALFQLGPDVVSNQQARLGIQSVNTARLGGATGKLFELRSGGTASLGADASRAAKIVDEVINQVTGLRGRLGAFQKTTLETNIYALNDTLANLTEAQSSIRDADFAQESAKLTRAQILVQSGTSVLSIANSNPQNVLALLR